MRKILLGTTAVVGAALIGMGAAQAQTAPTVRLGGFMEIAGAYINDDNDKNVLPYPAGTTSRDKFDFRNEFELHVFVTGKAANGLSYGLTVEFQMDNAGGGAGSVVDLDEGYLWISSPTMGSLRIGDEDSAASLLQVRVPTITGMGPDGNWDELLTSRALTSGAARNGNSYMLSGINDGSDSTKIIYLSPQFFGFDFGVSYAPNANEGERAVVAANTVSQRDRTGLRNELSAGVRYRGSFGNIGVQAGFGAMRADAQDFNGTATARVNLQDVTAYTFGLQVSGFGLTVGGEYTWGKYQGASVGRAALPNGADGSHHWVLGATYTMGALSFGGYYGQGEQDRATVLAGGLPVFGSDRKQTAWGLGAAYNLAPGLDLIASYNSLSDKNGPDSVTTASNKRDVDVIYAGFRLAF